MGGAHHQYGRVCSTGLPKLLKGLLLGCIYLGECIFNRQLHYNLDFILP